MAESIRIQLQKELVARLAAIAGWTATHRGRENPAESAVHAIVYPTTEDKKLGTIDLYECTLRVEVLIIARAENTDATIDEGNAFFYLDRLVAQAEAVLHTPDVWGSFQQSTVRVQSDGHDVNDPTEDNELAARLFVTFQYRHLVTDPSQ